MQPLAEAFGTARAWKNGDKAMHDDGDDKPKPRAYTVGQDVSAFAIADLDAQIAALEAEILRLKEARRMKSASQAAADALFRKPG